MRKAVTTIAFMGLTLSLVAAPVAAQKNVINSEWTATPVKIDGQDQEWQGATLNMDKGSKAEYALKNDGQNLYIIFVFKDPASRSTIDLMGMTVYYNLEGKKKKADGLHFVKREMTADELIASIEARGEVLTEEKKAAFRTQPGYVLFEGEMIGGAKGMDAAASAPKVDPPTFRTQQKQRVAIYEYRIPLAKNPMIGGIGTAPGESLKLYFEWGGMTKAMMNQMLAQAADGSTRTSSRGASLESGMSGGDEGLDTARGGMDSIRRNPMAKKHTFWIDVKLAGPGQ